jgi:hypothetical protein
MLWSHLEPIAMKKTVREIIPPGPSWHVCGRGADGFTGHADGGVIIKRLGQPDAEIPNVTQL